MKGTAQTIGAISQSPFGRADSESLRNLVESHCNSKMRQPVRAAALVVVPIILLMCGLTGECECQLAQVLIAPYALRRSVRENVVWSAETIRRSGARFIAVFCHSCRGCGKESLHRYGIRRAYRQFWFQYDHFHRIISSWPCTDRDLVRCITSRLHQVSDIGCPEDVPRI